ncbi:hypothetical protein Bbelb_342080 [Branchiostoma belcheri]|nr:hypothetical protein Bbelb_342080 [Branchiostoma belcheri]
MSWSGEGSRLLWLEKVAAVSWSGEGSRLLWLEVRGDVFTTQRFVKNDATPTDIVTLTWLATAFAVDDWVKGNKGTGGGKARRKLVLGEPQPCPEETDLDDTLELEELLQLLKDGEDQPPAQPSTLTNLRDTSGKDGSVETLRRAQNVVNAGASTSFTLGIVGGEEPPPRQNTNDSGSDLFTGGFHTSLGENSTEVRLPLHDNVFITVGVFKDRPLISVRQFYSRAWDPTTLRPGKKGLSLTPAQWTTLKDLRIYEAVNDITFSALPPTTTVKQHMFNLGNLRYAVVELIDGQPSVGLWQYERRSSDTTTGNDHDLLRTEKGISLTLQQWQAVEGKKKAVDWIMSAVVNGKSPLDSEVLKGIQF